MLTVVHETDPLAPKENPPHLKEINQPEWGGVCNAVSALLHLLLWTSSRSVQLKLNETRARIHPHGADVVCVLNMSCVFSTCLVSFYYLRSNHRVSLSGRIPAPSALDQNAAEAVWESHSTALGRTILTSCCWDELWGQGPGSWRE